MEKVVLIMESSKDVEKVTDVRLTKIYYEEIYREMRRNNE